MLEVKPLVRQNLQGQPRPQISLEDIKQNPQKYIMPPRETFRPAGLNLLPVNKNSYIIQNDFGGPIGNYEPDVIRKPLAPGLPAFRPEYGLYREVPRVQGSQRVVPRAAPQSLMDLLQFI
jgi:hypothetical protein